MGRHDTHSGDSSNNATTAVSLYGRAFGECLASGRWGCLCRTFIPLAIWARCSLMLRKFYRWPYSGPNEPGWCTALPSEQWPHLVHSDTHVAPNYSHKNIIKAITSKRY